MANAIRLSYKDADDVVKAFALNDLLMANMENAPMALDDDYYLAPYGYVSVPERKRKGENRIEHAYLLFTCYKVREMHDRALTACGNVRGNIRLLGSLGDISEGHLGLKVPESKIKAFRRYAWCGGDDVSLALEDHVFASACKELGVEAPSDWRVQRRAAFVDLGGDPDKLATLPAEAEIGFLPLTAEEKAREERMQAEREAREAVERAARVKEEKIKADADRLKRYLPTIDKYKDAAVPADDQKLCVFVFQAAPDGAEGPFCCPYDRGNGSPFCSMCVKMVAAYKAEQA